MVYLHPPPHKVFSRMYSVYPCSLHKIALKIEIESRQPEPGLDPASLPCTICPESQVQFYTTIIDMSTDDETYWDISSVK